MGDERPITDPPGQFDSAWFKWYWAERHAQALKDDINADAAHGGHEGFVLHRCEYDSKLHCLIYRVIDLTPVPARWGLMLGDAASNYRAALDHLAWALATRGKTPPGTGLLTAAQEAGIYFPFCDARHDFNCQIRVPPKPKSRLNLPGIRRADSAIVRRYQPYFAGKRGIAFHAFTYLPGLNTADKHREIRPVLASPVSAMVDISNPQDCTITRIPRQRRRILEIGAELYRVYVRKTGPNPRADMQIEMRSEPMLNEQIGLADWLTQIGRTVDVLLREFAEPPKEIHNMFWRPFGGHR